MVSGKELYQLMDNSAFVKRATELAGSPFLLFPPEDKKYGPYWSIDWYGTDRKHWKGGENEAVIVIQNEDAYLTGSGGSWLNATASEMGDLINNMLNTDLELATVNANFEKPITSDDFPLEAGYYILNFNHDSAGDVKALVAIQPPVVTFMTMDGTHHTELPNHPHLALMADKTAMGWDGETFVTGGINNLPALLMTARSNIGWAKVPHEDLIHNPDAINYLVLNY